jgi:hypothetical protein
METGHWKAAPLQLPNLATAALCSALHVSNNGAPREHPDTGALESARINIKDPKDPLRGDGNGNGDSIARTLPYCLAPLHHAQSLSWLVFDAAPAPAPAPAPTPATATLRRPSSALPCPGPPAASSRRHHGYDLWAALPHGALPARRPAGSRA